ncbi:MAG: hypothetical protein ACR2OV_00075 [Hyphomicrobiaceae bacterium]
MSDLKDKVLAGCQVDECAREVSYHLDMLRWWNDEPVCENCYDQERLEDALDWSDLEPLKIEQARA